MANRIEQEEGEQRFEVAVEKGIELALCEIAVKYEESGFPERLDYHNTVHTISKMARTELILRTIMAEDPKLVTMHKILLGRFADAYHDIEMVWANVNGKRVRPFGVSEENSVDRGLGYMVACGRQTFSVNDECVVDEAIMMTPAAYDPGRKLIYQPNLRKGVGVVAVAVALSDINACGLDGAQVFLRESDQVFVEENMDIAEVLEYGGYVDESWKLRIVNAAEFSLNFAKGRKLCIDDEIALLPERVRAAVRELFWSFDESIEAAELQLERRRQMSVEELLVELKQVIE